MVNTFHRYLNRSIFVTNQFHDPGATALMGWRAPVFCYVGLEPGSLVASEFKYVASMMDVTGTIRATKELEVYEDVARMMRQTGKPVRWEEALDGLCALSPDDLARIRGHLTDRRDRNSGPATFAALCGVMDRYTRDSDSDWQDLLEALERDRFTASAWFERDRAHLSLRDDVLDCDVFSLWDGEVQEELDSGYLCAPSRPRPTDADWLPQLVSFAEGRGLISSLRADQAPPTPERSRP